MQKAVGRQTAGALGKQWKEQNDLFVRWNVIKWKQGEFSFSFLFWTKLVLMCVRCVSSAAAPDKSLIRDAHLHTRLSHLGWFMQHRQRLNVASLLLFFPTGGRIWYQRRDTLQQGQTGKVSITELCKKLTCLNWVVSGTFNIFLETVRPADTTVVHLQRHRTLFWQL